MSLKRRNAIALLLLLLASLLWTFGQQRLRGETDRENITGVVPSSSVASAGSAKPTEAAGTVPSHFTDATVESSFSGDSVHSSTVTGTEVGNGPGVRDLTGYALCVFAVLAAGVGVFFLPQNAPFFGPDGICLLAGAYALAESLLRDIRIYVEWDTGATSTFRTTAAGILAAFAVLVLVRELWGWARARLPLSWCLLGRLSGRFSSPRAALLIFVGWIALALAGVIYAALRFRLRSPAVPGFFAASAGLGFACLWRYGADLDHFRRQLDSYQKGLPVEVGEGAFARAEAQLVEIRAQHEEAVKRAVTSERFKVELISNVSHDLRTPLTSILGYSELLQKEDLSPEGREQLRSLSRKAGYMSELVESLFELTKVSSGVAESRRTRIDLVRLLEQVVGLFDDQLTQAGLTVRRSYGAESLPVVTDGARMGQVFANLLGNAVKYALPGTRIYLEAKETPSGLFVRLMNTASYEMDFDPEEITQRFVRGDKARSTRGSGLGLAIAQTYTESVGGSFRVKVDGDQFSAIVEIPEAEQN